MWGEREGSVGGLCYILLHFVVIPIDLSATLIIDSKKFYLLILYRKNFTISGALNCPKCLNKLENILTSLRLSIKPVSHATIKACQKTII